MVLSMKKVAIVTIISRNYGNRLQNYALQTVLRRLGAIPETLPITITYTFRKKIKIIIKRVLSCVEKKYADVCWDLFDLNISWSSYVAQSEQLNSKYDFFVAGSDQIWNPYFVFNSDREFLTFADDNKKVAYAASIGIDKLPDNVVENYRNKISAFNRVSVRESSAADIIEQLGCERPVTVLDPTMLLDREDWNKIIMKSKLKIKKKYVVVYFLGSKSEKYDCYIRDKAMEMNAEIIDILNPPPIINKRIGPAEFVSLLDGSEAVFTDSYHGSVFSILFHKPFIVFERPYEDGYGKMSCRIDTLLHTFNLTNQRLIGYENMKSVDANWDCLKTEEILKIQRLKSLEFLKRALKL